MTKRYKPLTQNQIDLLTSQGCTAVDWASVAVDDMFDPSCLRDAHFIGSIRIGDLSGTITTKHGLKKRCGIYNAIIGDCTIGQGTRIANVSVHLYGYDVGSNVCIENAAVIQTNRGATFGNGVEVNVLNEAGGREVVLFDRLSAQFAYMMCLHRHKPEFIEKLRAIAARRVETLRSDRGTIGSGSSICSVGEIVDVNIGPGTLIDHATSLRNGTILSGSEAPTIIGADVIAEDFIVAESSSVTGGAMLKKVFVGQGCKIGRQYSAEESLFFANCEAFHGEAVSVFAGPYSVTHHKSTLLIAGLFSFYNAGSGTNQSNHMYKLGPAHEGKLQRGVKTGSFSYMMWPCRVGPFSVVLGKHTGTFDTSDYPFSHLEARHDGRCAMVPGLHLTTVGTVRDGAKWPKRDRRKGCDKRDLISFEVFSPYLIGKMIKANKNLRELQQTTSKSVEEVSIKGALVKRVLLRTCQKYYNTAIDMYLLEKIVDRTEEALGRCGGIENAFDVDEEAVYSPEWVDIGGQLMPIQRLAGLQDEVENGKITTVEAFGGELEKIHRCYKNDEWVWVRNTVEQVYGIELDRIDRDGLLDIISKLLKVKSKFLRLIIADAKKEFSTQSRLGFGQDGNEKDIDRDFEQVRGTYENNQFVRDMRSSIERLETRMQRLNASIAG